MNSKSIRFIGAGIITAGIWWYAISPTHIPLVLVALGNLVMVLGGGT